MPLFAVVDNTGRIVRYGTCPEGMVEEQAILPGEQSLVPDVPVSDLTYYYDGTDFVPRPDNPAVLSGMEIINVPVGSVVEIEGQRYPVDDGTAELSFSMPGTYIVLLYSFPYKDTSFEVTA